MPEANSGYFKKRDRGFTITLNKVLQDKNLSMSAIGLYSRINCYISIPNFEVSKSFISNSCKEGKKAFDSAWKELKNAGYLIQEFRPDKRKKGQFVVTYELLEEPAEDGIHTRYYNIMGKVTKVLHTSYFQENIQSIEAGTVDKCDCYDERGIESKDKNKETGIIPDNNMERCRQKIYTEDIFNHIPQKGGMVKNCVQNDHVPQMGGMVEQGNLSDRYPSEGITLKGININNTYKNNTCSMNLSSSSEYSGLLNSDITEHAGHCDIGTDIDKKKVENKSISDMEYSFDDFLQVAPNVSVKLKEFIRESIFNAAPESLYKVGKEKLVTKPQMIEHISLLEMTQIERIDEMLCGGKIYSINGLQTYLYNAIYLSADANKSRPSASRRFSERNYTHEEFNNIEKQLLGKMTGKANMAVPDG